MNGIKIVPSFSCSCGRIHTCPIKEVVIEKGALAKVPQMLKGYHHAVIVSDGNTRPLAFEALSQGLTAAGIRYHEVFFDQTKTLIPYEVTIGQVIDGIQDADVVIGIGSGVINDLCKYASFQKNLPYMIIATAPSMDGFASVVSTFIWKGMKKTLSTHVATWIVGDTGILKDAPMDMIRAGMGDILGKFSCLNDWKVACLVTGEHFCQNIYDATMKEALSCRDNIERCMARDEEAIGQLMNSLVQVGIQMAYMGNSRPASGSEHHFSHFFEITGVAFDEPYMAHGIDVAYSSILTAKLRERLLREDPAGFRYSFDPAAYETTMQTIFGPLANEVISIQKRTQFYTTDHLPTIRSKWSEIVKVLKEAPTGEEMTSILRRAGYDLESFVQFYGKERIQRSMVFAKDLKDRYTVVWLLQNAGLLESYAEGIVEAL